MVQRVYEWPDPSFPDSAENLNDQIDLIHRISVTENVFRPAETVRMMPGAE